MKIPLSLPARAFALWRKNQNLLWAMLAVVLVITMVASPQDVFEGAVKGLQTLAIIVPSLLPFFVVSELLMSLGIIKLLGVWLEPVMRPLFRLPGCSSFVLAVGYTSGYPIGAVLTARLREQQLCSRNEAERLLAFTSNASPLFMLVAIPVGMFHNPQLGIYIAAAHYLANIVIGLLLRFVAAADDTCGDGRSTYSRSTAARGFGAFRRRSAASARSTGAYSRGTSAASSGCAASFKQGWREFVSYNRQQTQTLGSILGAAVKNSVATMLNICGFIIVFAVLIRLFTRLGLISLISQLLGVLLSPWLEPPVLHALASGFWEMTIGSTLASEAAAPLLQRLCAVSLIIAWSGLSVQAQVASIISKTDLRLRLYCVCRVLQAVLAVFFLLLLAQTSSFQEAAQTIAVGSNITAGSSFDWLAVSGSSFFYSLRCGLPMTAAILGILFILRLVLFRKDRRR